MTRAELPPGVRSGRLRGDPFPAMEEGERHDTLLTEPGFRIERILSSGQATPAGEWYDQPGDEWVLLLEGKATVAFENGAQCTMEQGDWVFLPRRCKHRVESTSARPGCVWLAVHATPAPRT